MPFNEVFLNNAAKPVAVKSITDDIKYVREVLRAATKQLHLDFPVEIYMHGSYANDTNTYFPSNLEVCAELVIPDFDFTMLGNYYIKHNLPYTPKNFRDDLANTFEDMKIDFKESDKCLVLPKGGNLKHNVEITPCFSFKLRSDDNKEFVGILLHDIYRKADIASFPKLHQNNGTIKDRATNGNFKKMVRAYKSIKTIVNRENTEDYFLHNPNARGYFIECLLFNVPNELYTGKTIGEVFLKVTNYLSQAEIHDFPCQNGVWHLFARANEFWKLPEAHKYITSMRIAYNEFDEGRTELSLAQPK